MRVWSCFDLQAGSGYSRAYLLSRLTRPLQGRLDRRIGVELLAVLNGEDLGEPARCPVDPALDGAHGRSAHLSSLLV